VSCIRILIKTWVILVFIISLVFLPSVAAKPNVISVTHYPENPFSYDEITVYVEVNDTSNITSIELLYCQIEPEYICYNPPLNMTLGENNTYSTIITRDLEKTSLLGLNFTVTYNDDSIEYSPIGGEDYHYINITVSQDGVSPPCPTESNLAIQILIVILIIILVFLIIKHMKREDKTRPMDKKILGAIVIIFIVIFSVMAIIFVDTGSVSRASDFKLTDIDGNTFNLTDYRGQVVILDMMSIPCKSCKFVEADLKEVYPDYKDDVVFISIDILSDDTDDMLRDYRDEHDIEWPIARDTDELILKYNAESIPKIVIIDADGYATYEHTGLTEVNTLRDELDSAKSGEAEAIGIQEASFVSLAIIAGFAFFFSPCAFPMLPGYLAYYLKKGAEEGGKIPLRRAAIAGTISAAGIIIVSLGVGIAVIFAGSSIIADIGIFQIIVGIILIILGGLLLTPFQYWKIVRPFQALWARIRSIARKKSEDEGESSDAESTSAGGSGFYGGLFLYGLGYGAAAAGCTAPIFIAVLIAALGAGLIFGLLVLILYNLVAAVLMISITVAIAYFGAGAAQKLSQYTEVIKKVSGAVLVVVGIYLIWFYYTASV
jgi:cytochrome c-type biogenesis protein